MQPLKLTGRYEIQNANNRKEVHGDEKVLAMDLKLCGFASLAELVPLLGVESESAALGTLWRGESADLTLLNIESLKIHDLKFESLCGEVGGVKFSEAVASKFVIQPSAGGGTLTCKLSIPHPDDGQVAKFAQMIAETHKIRVEPMQEGLDLDEEGSQ